MGEPVTDPVVEPFFMAHLSYLEEIRQRVSMLSDDELERVRVMFTYANYASVPREFWRVAATVRAHCTVEQRRRAAAPPSQEAVPA